MHDWCYLLARSGLLRRDGLTGGLFRTLGLASMALASVALALASMALALGTGAWMIRIMVRREAPRSPGAPLP